MLSSGEFYWYNMLTWPVGVNKVDVVDRYSDKIGVITGMSSCPQMLCIGGCWENFIRPRIISTKWIPECHYTHRCCVLVDVGDNFIWPKIISTKWLSEYHLDIWTWLNSVMVSDTSVWGTNNIINGKQRSETRAWGIAAGHVRVVDYINSQILAKVSSSLALPSPDNFFVCANSPRLLPAPHKYHH